MSARMLRASLVLAAAAAFWPAAAPAGGAAVRDLDTRAGSLQPTAAQTVAAKGLRATVRWSRFGTPQSAIRHGGFFATGIAADDAVGAARAFLDANRALLGVGTAGLSLHNDAPLVGSDGHAVVFRQGFGGVPTTEGGEVTVGVVGSKAAGWKVAYLSSSLTRSTELAGARTLSAADAWVAAARNVGRGASLVNVGTARRAGEWTVFPVAGLGLPQRARPVAFPTTGGVRAAWETILVDVRGGHAESYLHVIDAQTGAVLLRRNLVFHSHDTAETFGGEMPLQDGACVTAGPWEVAGDEAVGSVAYAATATLPVNDAVIRLLRNGEIVSSQDTLFSPEAQVYDPPDEGRGTYQVQVCDYGDGSPWLPPATFTGTIAFNPLELPAIGSGLGSIAYPPRWEVFPSWPDERETWCWESTVAGQTLADCEREVANLASRSPWDYGVRTNAPTFTTMGNNAHSAEAWTGPLTPAAIGYRPVSPTREYVYPFTDAWRESKCFTPFVPGESHDVSAAVTNLFAMHNRMHDWSYNLGFTEKHWNAQDSNFGTGGTAEGDPLIGDAQAGALDGGFPSYLGRDNANMIPLPDGIPPITNMYLWQPLAGAFYAPCVDGDFDMAVIGHEFGHLVENRMIGKGGIRGGHHAGAMGESVSDLMAMEYLNEYGFVPAEGKARYAVGAYATGNDERAIRNFNMSESPLNFSNMGYDLTGPQVHADGEIWSATNFEIRSLLNAKYDGAFPSSDAQLQRDCADGKRPADQCPGNRRWAQIMFDAFLLMPVAPSMLDARDAQLAADVMRFGGANQAELWLGFAHRGFGTAAASTNSAADTPTDPVPDFASARHANARVTFRLVDPAGKAVQGRVLVGRYEGRTSPVADTDPATAGAANLDATAAFAPGRYELVANAPGYGHVRLARSFSAGRTYTVTIRMRENWASQHQGATASGHGVRHDDLIDDAEATNWERRGARPDVSGSSVTVDLGGTGARRVARVQVSAMLQPGQNRFTALRQFEIWTCLEDASNRNCTLESGWTKRLTSPADAFPGAAPRPVSPELLIRGFALPSAVRASHVRIVVVTNQCTGNAAFQGEQDDDPANGTDCREGSPGSDPVGVFGDLPQVLAPRDDEVRIAELQVFSR